MAIYPSHPPLQKLNLVTSPGAVPRGRSQQIRPDCQENIDKMPPCTRSRACAVSRWRVWAVPTRILTFPLRILQLVIVRQRFPHQNKENSRYSFMGLDRGRIRDSTGSVCCLNLSHQRAHRATGHALVGHHVRLGPNRRALRRPDLAIFSRIQRAGQRDSSRAELAALRCD